MSFLKFNFSIAVLGILLSIDALGLGSGIIADHSRRSDFSLETALFPPPTCISCAVSTQVPKEKTDSPPSWFCFALGTWYDYYEGYCQRYACSNGFYYTGPHWTWNGCSPEPYTAPLCPAGTCVP